MVILGIHTLDFKIVYLLKFTPWQGNNVPSLIFDELHLRCSAFYYDYPTISSFNFSDQFFNYK